MKGDVNKPCSTFFRWINNFWDGNFTKTKKGKKRIPSQDSSKKYERRWRRRKEKQNLKENNNE